MATWILPEILLNLLRGSKINAIAVKKLINSPIVFDPDVISIAPKIITAKKPTAAIISIIAGIPAIPASSRSLTLWVTLRISKNLFRSLFSARLSLMSVMPWNISSKRTLAFDSKSRFSPALNLTNPWRSKIGNTKNGIPRKAINDHFQSIKKTTATKEINENPSLPTVINASPIDSDNALLSALTLSMRVPGEFFW